jgi:hypothetical protein
MVILLAISIFVYIYTKKTESSLSMNLFKQEEIFKKYEADSGMVLDVQAIAKLEGTNLAKQKELLNMQSLFDYKNAEFQSATSDIGIYFFEILYATMKTLERKATAKKMIMPPVNFAIDAPKEEDIPYLLKQIEMIDDAVNIIIKTGDCELEAIKPAAVDKAKAILDYSKLSIHITMKSGSDAFVAILSELNDRIPLYLIEELSIKSLEQNKLKVSFILSRILIAVSSEGMVDLGNKNALSLEKNYPLSLEFKSFSKRNPFFRYKQIVVDTPGVTSAEEKISSPQFTYKGSIYLKGRLVGIIEDNWQKKVCFAGPGDICSEYKVISVQEKKAVLSKNSQEIILLKGANNE